MNNDSESVSYPGEPGRAELRSGNTPLPNELAGLIERDILTGKLAPATKLPTEGRLAQQFGISRNAVREALAQLRSAELVETRHGLGTFVVDKPLDRHVFSIPRSGIDQTELCQLFELRAEVESGAAALAARFRTNGDIAAMRDALDRLSRSIAQGASGIDDDIAFHNCIAAASGNRFFGEFLDFYARRVADAVAIARSNSARIEGWSRMVHFEHEAIHEAIAAGSPEEARAAMWMHLHNARRRLGLRRPAELAHSEAQNERKS
ncbi:MAG: FadR family transcriptional regulator [Ectothiorhodospiraceae bacterium]|nr:FadR family transcriptional regulator [Ectothiorhodospiraceae bacterium]